VEAVGDEVVYVASGGFFGEEAGRTLIVEFIDVDLERLSCRVRSYLEESLNLVYGRT